MMLTESEKWDEEYKNWIARENETPPNIETIDSFKEYWADVIALVNQTAATASLHGYGMAAMAAIRRFSHVNGYTDTFKVTGYTTYYAVNNSMDDTIKYYATEYMRVIYGYVIPSMHP